MIQFTEQEILKLRYKKDRCSWIEPALYKKAKEVYECPVLVPKQGIGNWSMYYFCEKCSVPLTFERNKPKQHLCPKCNTSYEGEPYDSSWWWFVNMQNSESAVVLGRLYLLSENPEYAKKTVELMLEYAKYYKAYRVHGDIPYNGPGKANAQTLDEAIFMRNFAVAYDLINSSMTAKEAGQIRDQLLIPGAEFLMKHRHNQIHNHEVIINSAIAIVGILFERNIMIETGLYTSYGLMYQLEHGMQADHIWFEGSFGYHYYALQSFMEFEKFAIHTDYSSIHHPNYQKMLEVALDYIKEDNSLPFLNDTYPGHRGIEEQYLYEFAFAHISSDTMMGLLNRIYQNQKRDNLEAFFYGVDVIEPKETKLVNHHCNGGSGYTVLRGASGRYLLFKHGNYGGEHDHYDRLGISYESHGRRIAADLGTTGYGALLHYDYYKNTGSHNTVMIGEENQPPACGQVLRYETKDDVVYIEAKVDWNEHYQMPDSFTIVQWDKESYQHVSMVRKIAWGPDFFVDLFCVSGVEENRSIDWGLHIDGEIVEDEMTKRDDAVVENEQYSRGINSFSEKKPWKHLRDVKIRPCQKNSWMKTKYDHGDQIYSTLFSYVPEDVTVFAAKGPDNPSFRDLTYQIERSCEEKAVFLHVMQTFEESESGGCIKQVELIKKDDLFTIRLIRDIGVQDIEFAYFKSNSFFP